VGIWQVTDWRSCDNGERFKVVLRKGNAVLSYSLSPNLEIDGHSLHSACPVGRNWTKCMGGRQMVRCLLGTNRGHGILRPGRVTGVGMQGAASEMPVRALRW
jgi:hypothetical protein